MVPHQDVLQLFAVNLHRNAILLNAELSFTMESTEPNAFGNIRHFDCMWDSKPYEMGSKPFRRIPSCIDTNRRWILCLSWHNIGCSLHKSKTIKKEDYDYRPGCASRKWILKGLTTRRQYIHCGLLQSQYLSCRLISQRRNWSRRQSDTIYLWLWLLDFSEENINSYRNFQTIIYHIQRGYWYTWRRSFGKIELNKGVSDKKRRVYHKFGSQSQDSCGYGVKWGVPEDKRWGHSRKHKEPHVKVWFRVVLILYCVHSSFFFPQYLDESFKNSLKFI